MPRITLSGTVRTKQTQKLTGRIRLSSLLKQSEHEFAVLVRDIENDDLFRKFMYSGNPAERLLRRTAARNAVYSGGFKSLNEAISGGNVPADIYRILDGHKAAAALIKQIGEAKFMKHILYNEDASTVDETARKCGINTADIQEINSLLNELAVHSEFFNRSAVAPGHGIRYTRIAEIVSTGHGSFGIKPLSPYLSRGKYEIDFRKFEKLRETGVISGEDLKKARRLFRDIETVNIRKTSICRIIESVIEIQSGYLLSGDPLDMTPFTQKELAKKLSLDESTVCRAIYGKSISTPHDREEPLKYFFPSKKDIRKTIIRDMVSSEEVSLTDMAIKKKLRELYGIEISRRSVTECRKELNIPAASSRKAV